MTTSTILVALLAFAASGAISFFVNKAFWSTNHAKTDRSSAGAPMGGFFALMSGALLGMMFFAYAGPLFLQPAEIEAGMIASMVGAPVFGFVSLFRSKRNPGDGDKK